MGSATKERPTNQDWPQSLPACAKGVEEDTKVKIICVLCNGEIPSGWPAIPLPKGMAHRFRTECDGINPITQEAIDYLHRNPEQGLGYTFTCEDAVKLAGDKIIETQS